MYAEREARRGERCCAAGVIDRRGVELGRRRRSSAYRPVARCGTNQGRRDLNLENYQLTEEGGRRRGTNETTLWSALIVSVALVALALAA